MIQKESGLRYCHPSFGLTELLLILQLGVTFLIMFRDRSNDFSGVKCSIHTCQLNQLQVELAISYKRAWLLGRALIIRHYNSSIQPRWFVRGDLVLRKVFQNTDEHNANKLGPNWKGLYRVFEPMKFRAYKLASMDGKEVPKSWHVVHLRNFLF